VLTSTGLTLPLSADYLGSPVTSVGSSARRLIIVMSVPRDGRPHPDRSSHISCPAIFHAAQRAERWCSPAALVIVVSRSPKFREARRRGSAPSIRYHAHLAVAVPRSSRQLIPGMRQELPV
jgi:hypothetical protein